MAVISVTRKIDQKDIKGSILAATRHLLYYQHTQELSLLPSRIHTILLSFCEQEPFIQTTTMQLLNYAIYAVTVLATIAAAVPRPIIARGEQFTVFNGDKSVMVETEHSAETGNVLAEGDVDCKGSALCEKLGSSCDDAYRKVTPSNTYSTYLEYVYALMRMDDLTFD